LLIPTWTKCPDLGPDGYLMYRSTGCADEMFEKLLLNQWLKLISFALPFRSASMQM